MLLNRIINKLKRISIIETILVILNKKEILFWSDNRETALNFGDAINPFLFSKLTSKKVVSANKVINFFNKPTFYFIGSILNNLNRTNAIICGSGFISQDATIKKTPFLIVAVRGPLTRDIFLKHGIHCPEVYCDPALLLPYFIPNKNKKENFDIGIIAHYVDVVALKNIKIISSSYSYKFISIEDEMNSFIQNICDCKYILSSSLHGIIVAHAYKKHATWIKLSDNLIGGEFKFYDYAFSTGSSKLDSYKIDSVLNLEEALEYSCIFDVKQNQDMFLDSAKQFDLLNTQSMNITYEKN